MDKKKIQNIGAVVLVIAGLFFFFIFFAGNGGNGREIIERNGSSAVVVELLAILDKLSQLEINTSIFDDPVYASLEDYTVTISAQPQGRSNPFEQF